MSSLTNRFLELGVPECCLGCASLPDNVNQPNFAQRVGAVARMAELCMGPASGVITAPNGVQIDIEAACGSAALLASSDRESVIVSRSTLREQPHE